MDSIVERTFLFTDIEGSTRLWEQDPERMSRALAQHDARARAAVENNDGAVVKMRGDGLHAAFDDPVDGLKATLALQHSLADLDDTLCLPLVVRCGLHLGQVEQRDNDYFGTAVNRTARIMDAAHGGQILVSEAVFERVHARLPADVSARDLGGVRLADLASPVRVYQILHPKLRQDFPPLRSLEATPNNLPQQLTTFFGREREIAEGQELLKKSRLLTLLGMGGLGKTRLSLQLAADALAAYPDGVWFLDLAPISDPTLVPTEAAKTLGVQEQPGTPLTQTLCSYLKQRKLLIILDNCEHLIAACATLANALLRAAPNVRIIATSREALRVPGEITYPVLPLPVPDATAGVEALSRSDAVQLFLDRARSHKPSFALNEREAPAVAELCARLEGIPLALELAAARMRALSVADINARLRDRFKLLTGGGRVLLARQQTLRALVDWSYDLLQDEEKVLFDRLSVFVGGFDLAAVEQVCGAEPSTPEDALDLLTSLVDKSLVTADESGDGSRYRTLETIRDYAREKLVQRGEVESTAAQHCQHYFAMAKTARLGLRGEDPAPWTRRLEADLDNLRAAIALALQGGVDPVIAVKLEVALTNFRILRGYASEGRNNIRAALALPAVQALDVAHAHALYVGGTLATIQSDYAEAARMLEACLKLRRVIANPVDLAATLSTLSLVRLQVGDPTCARVGEEEALGIFRQLGDRIGEAIGLLHLGQIALHAGEDDAARDDFKQSIAIARDIKHGEIESEGERMLGEIALESGDISGARAHMSRSLEVCRGAGDKRDEATSLWWMGKADIVAGDIDLAHTRLHAALRAFKAFEMVAEIIGCLEDHGTLALSRGCPEEAASLHAACATTRERLGLARPPRGQAHWQDDLKRTREALGDATFEQAWGSGRGWDLEEAIRRALAFAPRPVTA